MFKKAWKTVTSWMGIGSMSVGPTAQDLLNESAAFDISETLRIKPKAAWQVRSPNRVSQKKRRKNKRSGNPNMRKRKSK